MGYIGKITKRGEMIDDEPGRIREDAPLLTPQDSEADERLVLADEHRALAQEVTA